MATTFEITEPAVIDAIYGELPTIDPAFTLYVDKYRRVNTGVEDGSMQNPFLTIQAAIDALPAQTTNTELLVMKHILIAPGEYDEDLSIDMSWKRLTIGCWGQGFWKLGTFDNASGLPGAPLRNISITGAMTTVDSVGPELLILGSTKGEFVNAVQLVPSISGNIVETFDVTGAPLQMVLNAKVNGSITLNTDNTTGMSLQGCVVTGTIANGNYILDTCQIDNTIDVSTLLKATNCVLSEDITVAISSAGTGSVRGFINCHFGSTVFTGPAGSFVVDFYSNAEAKASGVTLAGGATTTLIGDTVALT